MNTALWVIFAFFCGSLPFSLWVGRWLLGRDIRTVGDSNPGATNVLRAGGRGAAALALALDWIKGSIPVSLAYAGAGFTGWRLVIIALAPVLGHAFSPFLGFRGGKAMAVTGGIWTGLTAWEGPLVGGVTLGIAARFLGANGWAVLAAMTAMLLYFLVVPPLFDHLYARPDTPTLVAIWLGNVAILALKYRADLAQRPQLRRRGQQGPP